MLDVIHEEFVSSAEIRQFKAPAGYMYEIYCMAGSNPSQVSGNFRIVRRYVEEGTEEIPESDVIFAHSTYTTLNMVVSLAEPIRAKFLSMGNDANAAINYNICIYYKLVKAKEADLVYEFVKRGKNP